MKELYNSMVDYFADNILHAALVASVSIILIFVLLIVLSFSAAYAKKAKAAKKKTPAPKATVAQKPTTKPVTPPAAKPAAEEKPIVEEKPAEQPVEEELAPAAPVAVVEEVTEVEEEPAPIEEVAEEPAPVEEFAEEPAPIEEVAEEPAPIEEVTEEPAPVEEVVEEPAPIEEVAEEPAPIEEVAEEPAPIEEVAEEPAPVEEVTEEPAPVEEVAEEPAPIEEVAEEPAPAVQQTAKAKTEKAATLLDELKDVNTDIDFYEEDAADQEARYKGKWVICRIVTEDKSAEESYFFELHASNGEKLLTSEEYTTYSGAMRGIQTHKNNILKGNFRITTSKRGDYIFKLLSGKNMLLCMGEGYATKARCEAAIESAKRFAKTAIVDENIQYQVVKVPVEDDDTPIEAPKGNSKGKWVIDTDVTPDGETVYFFELFANNGERLLSSEEYSTYVGAVNGIQTHKTNISKGNFRITLTKRGDYIYKLLNSNGQLLCLGEHYKTKRLCQNAVESVKRFSMNSPTLVNSKIKK